MASGTANGLSMATVTDDFETLTAAITAFDLGRLRDLVANGANVNACNQFGDSVFEWAVSSATDRDLPAFAEDPYAPLRLLLELGADANQLSPHGHSVLLTGIFSCDPAMVKFLLDHGCDPNLGCADDWETLFDAALFDYEYEAWIQPDLPSLHAGRSAPFQTPGDEIAFLQGEAEARGYLLPEIPRLMR